MLWSETSLMELKTFAPFTIKHTTPTRAHFLFSFHTEQDGMFCSVWYTCALPVIFECIRDGLADELAVLFQGVECVLHSLVNSFLNGATHLLNLVNTATWLCRAEKNIKTNTHQWLYLKRQKQGRGEQRHRKLTIMYFKHILYWNAIIMKPLPYWD